MIKWYPISPVLHNETRPRLSGAPNWRQCIVPDGKVEYRAYDPYGVLPLPTGPGAGVELKIKKYKTKGSTEVFAEIIRRRNAGETFASIGASLGMHPNSVKYRYDKIMQKINANETTSI